MGRREECNFTQNTLCLLLRREYDILELVFSEIFDSLSNISVLFSMWKVDVFPPQRIDN